MLTLATCLIGWQSDTVRCQYKKTPSKRILKLLLDNIETILDDHGLSGRKQKAMMDNFCTLKQIENLSKDIEIEGKEVNPIRYVLSAIDKSKLHGLLESRVINVDVFGEAYLKLISCDKYFGNAKTGFVMTPRHICDLCADIAQIGKDTKFIDTCFGTGGLLVAGMQRAIRDAKEDSECIDNIKRNNIYGIELDGDRFTYGCINMMLRGDGKSNMEIGDCFNTDIKDSIIKAAKQLDVGIINPPYNVKTKSPLEFVENMLGMLKKDGIGICIVPTSCALNNSGKNSLVKKRIIEKNRLLAVISLPEQLFYPTGTVTCIMVFRVGKDSADKEKTWLGNLKNDGFEINRKSGGRADTKNEWQGIKNRFLDAYRNKEEVQGLSVTKYLTAEDEWLYEVHNKEHTDITEEDFIKTIKEFALYELGRC